MLGKQPRLKAALDLVAAKSGWGQALPLRVGRGVCVQTSFASFIATVVEAEVDQHGEVVQSGRFMFLVAKRAAAPTAAPA